MRRAAAAALLAAVAGYFWLRPLLNKPEGAPSAAAPAGLSADAASPGGLTAAPLERAVDSLPAVKLDSLRGLRRRKAAEPPSPSP